MPYAYTSVSFVLERTRASAGAAGGTSSSLVDGDVALSIRSSGAQNRIVKRPRIDVRVVSSPAGFWVPATRDKPACCLVSRFQTAECNVAHCDPTRVLITLQTNFPWSQEGRHVVSASMSGETYSLWS